MRHFTSYGPAEAKAHYFVERKDLVERCVQQLVGDPAESAGHFFTMWGPRQTGKTWVMRQAVEEIRQRYGERFAVGTLSMEGIIGKNSTEETFFDATNRLLLDGGFVLGGEKPRNWQEWAALFAKSAGTLDRPTILLIDEFDCLPPAIMDGVVRTFRRIYLNRSSYHLHGLALIGVRSVLGVDSDRGSPFNVQRSLQVPNLKHDEVVDLFRQYQSENGQTVEPDVVDALYDVTRGQPGLVGWFGELLTEKFNPGPTVPIVMPHWHFTYGHALYVEWNNTLLNLSKKAKEPYRAEIMRLFTDPHVPFDLEKPWCNHLYMNGIIDWVTTATLQTSAPEVGFATCRFSCPFIQRRLFSSLSSDMFGTKGPLLAIEIGDSLEDVFTADGIHVSALLDRYRGYLQRLQAKGIDPWLGQPRRQDLHYTEAVGHFHLYAWLQNALNGYHCSVSPEFPTGNGKVDLILRTSKHAAIIEVKSFTNMPSLAAAREQAAAHARKLGIGTAIVVVFAPTNDDAVVQKLADERVVDGIRVITAPFGWV